MHVWVYIMDGAEIDRRVCAENRKGGQGYEEADRYEQDMRATRGFQAVAGKVAQT